MEIGTSIIRIPCSHHLHGRSSKAAAAVPPSSSGPDLPFFITPKFGQIGMAHIESQITITGKAKPTRSSDHEANAGPAIRRQQGRSTHAKSPIFRPSVQQSSNGNPQISSSWQEAKRPGQRHPAPQPPISGQHHPSDPARSP
ncbi:hypothetical protein ACLOJK_034883 [Asimina triloba]